MPIYTKKQLRRTLGKRYIHDLAPFSPRPTGFTILQNVAPFQVMDSYFADIGNSGQNLYQGAWLYIESSANVPDTGATMYQYLVASFNCGSGAFISTSVPVEGHSSADMWELHTRVSPYDKDNAIDDTIKRLRLRREVAFPTMEGALFYPIDQVASPNILDRVLDVHVFANPSGSTSRDIRHVDDWQVVTTATGNEIRFFHAMQGSQQIIFDAILIPSLGGEQGTILVEDERWVLAGAAARCYDFLIQSAPAQQVALLAERRKEMALEFSRLSSLFTPTIDKPIRMNDIVAGRGGNLPSNTGGWW